MRYSTEEILDETIDQLELSVRSVIALKKRFGDKVLVREIVMLSEEQLIRLLKPFHKYPRIFVTDINKALLPYRISLGTSWAELPHSRHTIVRNPRQMEDHSTTL